MKMYAILTLSSDVVLMLSGATMFWLSPLLRRSWVLGYGSARSMINDDTWRAGNRFAGLSLALLTLMAMLLQVSLWESIESSEVGQAASAVSTLSLPFLVMVLTEKYLARTFRT
jgi:hypothetical protein